MRIIKSKVILLIAAASLIVGCIMAGPKILATSTVSNPFNAFLAGDVRLECGVGCSFNHGFYRSQQQKLIESKDWVNLANLTMRIGTNSSNSYYYLGLAAEGLKKPSTAIIYYRLAIASSDTYAESERSRLLSQEHLAALEKTQATPTQKEEKIVVADKTDKPPTKENPQENSFDKTVDFKDKGKIGPSIKLQQSGGVYEVPVIINDVLKINVILDSGASDVSISPDVALTLIKTGTIKSSDWLPGQVYQFADGSTALSYRFKLSTIALGDRTLRDVSTGIGTSVKAPMLLGQSALKQLGKYTINYSTETLDLE